jgi:hypothetical protein
MAEWIPVATAGAFLPVLVLLLLVLIRQHAIAREQAETNRVLGLLMDMVEFQAESAPKRVEAKADAPSDDRPSIIAYQKPKLTVEAAARRPPPPPPAKLKRW